MATSLLCGNKNSILAFSPVLLRHGPISLSKNTARFFPNAFRTTSKISASLTTPLTTNTTAPGPTPETPENVKPPLYLAEGLLPIHKPKTWTSQDVVSYLRKMLEHDARRRGAKPLRLSKRGNKSRMIKIGHGGTLDPLATGVLVVGVGRGTKMLGRYLAGRKAYSAVGRLGSETDTLDEEVSLERMEEVLERFRGKILQVPPVYSAIKKGGKKLYEEAREGKTAEDLGIEAREVEVYRVELCNKEKNVELPHFALDVECGGGTFIRSLVRDVANAVGTVATMTDLVRTKQGIFELDHALEKDDWNAENVYKAIEEWNERLLSLEEGD